MSTLFETYFDGLGHELMLGSMVMGLTSGYTIYGHVINFEKDKKGDDKIVITPNIGYHSNKEINLRKKYSLNYKRVFLININK